MQIKKNLNNRIPKLNELSSHIQLFFALILHIAFIFFTGLSSYTFYNFYNVQNVCGIMPI